MSGRTAVKSAFQNLRPTIIREPARTTVSLEAENRLLSSAASDEGPNREVASVEQHAPLTHQLPAPNAQPANSSIPLLLKKKRERLLLVSFRMPQGLKERLERAAKTHEINQTDIINEAIEINLKRYL